LTKKLSKNDRANVKAVGRKAVKLLDGDVRGPASSERLPPPRLPVAPLKRLLKELAEDRQDRD
jgi:hypothetical protein